MRFRLCELALQFGDMSLGREQPPCVTEHSVNVLFVPCSPASENSRVGGFTNSRVRVFRNSRVKKCPEIIGDRRSPRWATLAKSSSAPPSRTAASRRRTGRAQRRAALRPPPRSRARPPRPSAAAGRRCTRAPAATRGRGASSHCAYSRVESHVDRQPQP